MLKIRPFKIYHAMPDRLLRRGMLAAGCLLISTVAATAQMFGNEADKPQVVPQIATRPTTSSRPGQQPARALQNRRFSRNRLNSCRQQSLSPNKWKMMKLCRISRHFSCVLRIKA